MTIQEDFNAKKPDITLNLRGILDDLVTDGRLASEDAEVMSSRPRSKEQLNWNPLELIADEDLSDQKNPTETLDIETLTHWLSERAGQAYYRIDPLKIDAQAVTQVMSYPFAQRHGILAVEVTDDEVVIASAQPTPEPNPKTQLCRKS